jgi:excisionase family DNA binding protein
MNDRLSYEWLTLSDVAEKLGVHPSTVRLWSDKGALPVHRTTGGHRRYKLSEVELWMQTSREHRGLEPASAMQMAVGKIRMQIGEGRLQEELWYQKLDDAARMQYRLSGMTLVNGLMAYLAREGADAATEAFAIGYDYASRARRYNLSNIDATHAYLFFRNTLLEAVINVYHEANVPSKAWSGMLHKMHAFTDQILITLLETYHALEEKTEKS